MQLNKSVMLPSFATSIFSESVKVGALEMNLTAAKTPPIGKIKSVSRIFMFYKGRFASQFEVKRYRREQEREFPGIGNKAEIERPCWPDNPASKEKGRWPSTPERRVALKSLLPTWNLFSNLQTMNIFFLQRPLFSGSIPNR